MSTDEWRGGLSASQRYEAIQKILATLPSQSMNEAISLEQTAYQDASSLDEYEAACLAKSSSPPNHSSSSPGFSPASPSHDFGGTVIGDYTNCHPIAEGVTSDVYRSGSRALKVITAHRPIAPHSPQREIKILRELRRRPHIIELAEDFRDSEGSLVLVFPYMPFSLAGLLENGTLELTQVRSIFADVLAALVDIHARGIVHRDVKPSAVLLASPSGPAYLSDFGTAWHPSLSAADELADDKILDIGTGPYRAPEVLFGNKSYGPPVDMWGCGVMLSEALRSPPSAMFESRSVHEDGNQLGLILSIFKTLGTPTPETWPEAKGFKVEPFELWTVFPARPWDGILPDVDEEWRRLVAALVRYDGKRATAGEALAFDCISITSSEK